MENYATQEQIAEVNRKLDLLLVHVNNQRLKSQEIEDLMADVSIVSKDAYDSAIVELENQMLEVSTDDLRILSVKFLKNIRNFTAMLDALESMFDFTMDAEPIAREILIDASKKLNELDRKGYFEFFRELGKIVDNVVTNFSADDVKSLADNIVLILNTVKSLTQPEMMKAINNAVSIYGSMNTKDIPEYSLWRTMREMNSPEMKKGMGLIMTFLKEFYKSTT